jgi:ATP-dependent Clp protease protease subunit
MFKAFKNEATQSGEILLYDVIGSDWFGEGVSAKKFADSVSAMGEVKTITIRINSPGGSVFDGHAIYNTLVKHPARKIVEIDGLAASAASFIAMAGDEIRMAEIGMMMIHLAIGMTIGNRPDHEREAGVLAKLDDTIAATYAARAGKEPALFLDLMGKETWLNAAEALEMGLVTSVLPAKGKEKKDPAACVGPDCIAKAAKFAAKAFGNMPDKAKLFFSNVTKSPPKGGKGSTMSKKKNGAACGCKNRRNAVCPECGSDQVIETESGYSCEACGATWAANAAGYASLMNAAIDAAVTEERTKEAILQELADASGLELDAVSMLLSDEGGCPTQADVDAFAGVEGMPSADDQKTTATADGCTFEEAEPPVEEGSPENAVCVACDGTGDCEKCDGTGSANGEPFDCPLCDGSGDCMFCGGTGEKEYDGADSDEKQAAVALARLDREEVKQALADAKA